MTEAIKTYRTRVHGLLGDRHTIYDEEGEIGVLTMERKFFRVVSATYRPKKGEVLLFRRDPGLLRGQFSMWTEHREWLGSSLRWNFLKRELRVETGSRPYRVLPLPAFRRGWRLCAPKTGEMARIDAGLFGRGTRMEVYRRMDFELLLFSYFLGSQVYLESIWPGPGLEEEATSLPSPSKA